LFFVFLIGQTWVCWIYTIFWYIQMNGIPKHTLFSMQFFWLLFFIFLLRICLIHLWWMINWKFYHFFQIIYLHFSLFNFHHWFDDILTFLIYFFLYNYFFISQLFFCLANLSLNTLNLSTIDLLDHIRHSYWDSYTHLVWVFSKL